MCQLIIFVIGFFVACFWLSVAFAVVKGLVTYPFTLDCRKKLGNDKFSLFERDGTGY